jgi:SOS-response transcriptional repressor LexA
MLKRVNNRTGSKNTTLQVSSLAHAAFKAACEQHPMHLPMTATLNALLQWFATQDRRVQTAIIANVDAGMEAAYADALERLARELRNKALKSLEQEPAYDLNVAAGEWVNVVDVPEVSSPADQSAGRFYLRISGRSMEPHWRDGSSIEFRIVEPAALSRGDDVYVQRRNGSATFKRVSAIGKNQIRLAAINRQAFPDELHVQLNQIARAAIAVEPMK